MMKPETTKKALATVLALATLGAFAPQALADPCGMVPPITIIEGDPIVRIGVQKTYVFHRNGIETVVIRPGFKGKVDEFGMLIPFPSPPAIRKVDENIFAHIASAIDPPEVIAYVQRQGFRRSRGGGLAPSAAKSADSAPAEQELRYDQVRVVRQEAVGMYDVAVLEAGSASALSRWMKENGFRYPEGMDDPVNDYVRQKWAFVAVKTRVGQKAGVNPTPGMKDVDSKLPAGATFDGHVQAMGFRFVSKDLVVPMRLSAFNKGDLRNIVYILTDDPMRIRHIPKKYVMRQISGKELFRNVTGPLPLRVIGGTYEQLTPWQQQNLKRQRDATPHNGMAKLLFASDLLATKLRRLSNPSEEKEKELLSIGEALGLRGKEMDDMHAKVLEKDRDKQMDKALAELKSMTMTVVDGDFDRQVIARDNLRFARYRMPDWRNSDKHYDARHQGPAPQKGGKLYRGHLEVGGQDNPTRMGRASSPLVPGLAVVVLLGVGVLVGFRRKFMGVVVLALSVVLGSTAFAQTPDVGELMEKAIMSDDIVHRGKAIVALSELGDTKADKILSLIHNDPNQDMLVRTWAAAGRLQNARTVEELQGMVPLVNQFPATRRTMKLKMGELLRQMTGPDGIEKAITLLTQMSWMAQDLAPTIIAQGADPLVKVLYGSNNQTVRQWAASYLSTLGQTDAESVAKEVIVALRFRKRASKVPWDGGPLWLPGIQWSRKDAKTLSSQLMKWYLWAEDKGRADIQRQIQNNLNQLTAFTR